jgi:uncharacterized repeat protein (TIGR01451 family)
MAAKISWKRRVLFAFVAATVLVAITAVPSMVGAAPAKKYSLAVSPTIMTAGDATPVVVTMKNETPPGTNSNPSSFYVTVPFDGAITLRPTVSESLAGSSNANLSATVEVDPSNSRRILVKSLDPVNKGQFVKLTFTVTPASCTGSPYNWILDAQNNPTLVKVVNGASLNGDTFAPVSTDVTTTVSCAPPSLSVTKTAVSSSILVGASAQFDITVSNASGAGAASNVGVSDALPTGLNWSIVTQTGTFCSIPSTTLICTIPTLAGGASYSVRIGATASALGTVTNGLVTVSLNGSPVDTDGPASVGVFETPIVCDVPLTVNGEEGTDVTVTLLDGCEETKNATITATTSDEFQHQIEILAGGTGGPVTFLVESTWAPEPIPDPIPPDGDAAPTPLTTVRPACEPGGTCSPTSTEPEVWCDFEASSPATMNASVPDGHSWCRISQDTQIAGVGLIRVHEFSLLINLDPIRGRN